MRHNHAKSVQEENFLCFFLNSVNLPWLCLQICVVKKSFLCKLSRKKIIETADMKYRYIQKPIKNFMQCIFATTITNIRNIDLYAQAKVNNHVYKVTLPMLFVAHFIESSLWKTSFLIFYWFADFLLPIARKWKHWIISGVLLNNLRTQINILAYEYLTTWERLDNKCFACENYFRFAIKTFISYEIFNSLLQKFLMTSK